MIISVSAVSAAEDIADSADVLAQDDSTTLEADDAVDVQADPEPAAEPAANFTTLQTEISKAGNNLTLEKDYTRVTDENDIVITKNFTIDGQDKYTLDAKNLGGIFKVTNGNTLTLKGLTLINGIADEGSAVYVAKGATLIVDNVKFIDNAAKNGGAISNYGIVDIDHSLFDGNALTNVKGEGNAIYSEGSLTINNTKFTNNPRKLANRTNGDQTSGVIANVNSNLNVYNSNFTNNSAIYGGVISSDSEIEASTVVDNCRFIENTGYDGGVISSYGVNLTVKDSYFEGNVAYGNGSQGFTAAAGAIYVVASTGNNKISGSTFKNNKAYDGANPAGGAILLEDSCAVIDDCEFDGNYASGIGGAIAISKFDESVDVAITKSNFTNNKADNKGGAIFAMEETELKVSESKFEGNTAENGTAIYNKGNLTVSNNTFGENDEIESEKKVNKDGSNVTISPITNVTYGNPVVVYFKVENSTGYPTVKVSQKSGNLTTPYPDAVFVINNENVTVTNLTAGQYVINIINNEDNNFAGSFDSAVFNVTKATPVIEIQSIKVDEYGNIVVMANITKGASGYVTYLFTNLNTSANTTKTIGIEEGYIKYGIYDPFAQGKYNVQISYDGDDLNFAKAETVNATVELTKETPVITITATVNEYGAIVVNATITKDVSGNVTFLFINTDTGKNMTVPIEIGENGTIEYDEFTPFEKGFYTVAIDYGGNDKYYGAHNSTYVEVNKTAPTIDVDVSSIENNVTVKVTATNDTVSGKVNITLFDKDGKTVKNITKDMVNGVVEEVTFTGIEIGDYLVRADFLGSDDFYQTFAVNETNVRASTEMNVTATVNQFGQIVVLANLTEGATGTVLFIITNSSGDNIVNLTVEIHNSTALDMTTDILAKGFYSVKAIYSGDDHYATTTAKGNNVEIAKEYLNVTSKVSIMDGANQATIVFTFSGNASRNATAFFLNYGTNATYAIQNGTVVIDEIFDNGPQSILLTYDGDDKYYGFYDVYADFFVKTSSFISAKDVNVVYQNNGKVTVTLYDNNDGKGKNPIVNAEVVITLNGKTYKATTNSKGIATVTIAAKLVPKKYTATVSYAGTNITVGDKETFKFTVKKATPKLTAKKKTFKAKTKVKKYTIVLKDNKNKAMKKVKVYLKVKGKTYTAKTNSKGKATFKIKNLKKKGTYKAKVTFKATKYFNKVTKTAKIKVKR